MTSIQSLEIDVQPNLLLNHTIVPQTFYTTFVQVAWISNTSNYVSHMIVRYMALDAPFDKVSPWYLSYFVSGNGT